MHLNPWDKFGIASAECLLTLQKITKTIQSGKDRLRRIIVYRPSTDSAKSLWECRSQHVEDPRQRSHQPSSVAIQEMYLLYTVYYPYTCKHVKNRPLNTRHVRLIYIYIYITYSKEYANVAPLVGCLPIPYLTYPDFNSRQPPGFWHQLQNSVVHGFPRSSSDICVARSAIKCSLVLDCLK